MRKLFTALAAMAALSFAAPASAQVTLLTDANGILTGATGVNVNGSLYNVSFADGTCGGLFSGCDSVSDFNFQNATDATAAAQALLDQVFIDSFDTHPATISGCTDLSWCFTFIPYAVFTQTNEALISYTTNNFTVATDTAFSGGFWQFSENTALRPDANVALFTYTGSSITAVPEPATWAMMLLGFGSIGFQMRRQRKQGPLAQAA